MTTTTDFQPGDVVQHPKKGRGYVLRHDSGGRVRVISASETHAWGYVIDTDFDGWERVETVRPGHVQVRVDDLDLSEWDDDHIDVWNDGLRAAVHAAQAKVAQTESRKEPAQPGEPQEFGARVRLVCPGQKDVRWARQYDGYWASEHGAILNWDDLTSRGFVTLGWSEDQ